MQLNSLEIMKELEANVLDPADHPQWWQSQRWLNSRRTWTNLRCFLLSLKTSVKTLGLITTLKFLEIQEFKLIFSVADFCKARSIKENFVSFDLSNKG